jgi:hypothetical protein
MRCAAKERRAPKASSHAYSIQLSHFEGIKKIVKLSLRADGQRWKSQSKIRNLEQDAPLQLKIIL